VNIPRLELLNAEHKCNMLAEIDESFQYIIENLERRFGVNVRVQMIRPVIGGGAGQKQIILSEIHNVSS
jgi:hypothetical protein